jgi:hypothetical protein
MNERTAKEVVEEMYRRQLRRPPRCSTTWSPVHGWERLRAARAVSELEQRTGRLVLHANQVLLWSIIAAPPAPLTIKGWGKLFRHFRRQPPDPPSRRRSADRKATRLRASHGTLTSAG